MPVGNGSLINGIGAWAKAHLPDTKIIGVVAENAPSMLLSWQADKVINTNSANTIADGIAIRRPIWEAVQLMREVVDDVMTVSETEIEQAAEVLLTQENLVVEPAGCVSLAAIIKNKDADQGLTVGNLICCKNIRPISL